MCCGVGEKGGLLDNKSLPRNGGGGPEGGRERGVAEGVGNREVADCNTVWYIRKPKQQV